MAFLDNSGDIILDAVLTDLGRQRLAKGDGSFNIAKFALGDEEINYQLYNKNHPSGSAYYDLEILQTPVLEAFTNNASSMKSRLVSIQRTDLLYLPVIKQSEEGNSQRHSSGVYNITVDETTTNAFPSSLGTGIYDGNDVTTNSAGKIIELHQGLDTLELSKTLPLDQDLIETQYIIEIDGRLGRMWGPSAPLTETFIDDDGIYTYIVTLASNPTVVSNLSTTSLTMAGPRGTMLSFRISATTELRTSGYLFDTLNGGLTTSVSTDITGGSSVTCKYIDTTVRIVGVKTGYSLDLPVRFIKKA